MKELTIIIATLCAFSANGRLLEKNTEKSAETPPTEPTSAVRVSRQAFYDDALEISREDTVPPPDEFRPHIRRGRYSVKSKSDDAEGNKAAKESHEVIAITKNPIVQSVEAKQEKTLVKKPIPKFNEVDYEDFQGKMNKSPAKLADSGEHEDEDFNLDDYEFDVNHDEFVGRGKPLEPRTKVKIYKGSSEKKTPKIRTSSISPPEIKMQSKVIIPAQPLIRTKHGINKKAAYKLKEDYYDDVVPTTKAPEVAIKRDSDDEFSDDTEESKEFNNKNPVRVVRSPWLVELLARKKVGDKTATALSKVVHRLPHLFGHETFPSDNDGIVDPANLPMVDPLTGNRFMY